ncbi:MAG: RHS repeat protein, partial [Bdellovibrionales bacterium]|nr:RHS repeat protein [Bdellovibrionales bacterium]
MRRNLLLITLMFPSLAYALVDMRNANFSDPWIHMEVAGSGYDMSVRTTYNSRTLYNGDFGFGWCSSFETKLTPNPDGTLLLTECGAGDEITFYPQNFKKADVKGVVDQIIEGMKKSGGRFTAKYYNDLSDQLFNDPKKRAEMAAQYKVAVDLKEGSIFKANLKSVDAIKFVKGQYVRSLPDATIQNFDKNGKMVRQLDRNGNYLTYTYNSKGQIEKVSDNNSRQLNFVFGRNNKVEKISGPNGLSASFKYNGQDLVEVTNAWKNKYTFKYDALHNLTHIYYPDSTFKQVSYDTNKDWVTNFKHRDGCNEAYSYETDKKDPKRHYWSTLTKVCKNKTITKSKYEFWFKPSVTGQGDYLSKVASVVNGAETIVEYHPIHEKPIYTKENNIVTKYDYYDNGLIKAKKVGNLLTSFKYSKCNKISEVKAGKEVTQFSYDGKCNLTFAKNVAGLAVKLDYDRNGRIV